MKSFEHKDYLVILDYNHNGCLAIAIGDNDYFKIQYQGYSDRQIKGRMKYQIDYRIEQGITN